MIQSCTDSKATTNLGVNTQANSFSSVEHYRSTDFNDSYRRRQRKQRSQTRRSNNPSPLPDLNDIFYKSLALVQLAQQQNNFYPNMYNANIAELTRTFSDTVLQSSSSIYYGGVPPWLNNNFCQIPCRSATDHTFRGNRRTKRNTNLHDRACSVGDIASASENYAANINDELNRLKNFRKWELTDTGRSYNNNPKPGLFFTLMTYNVLAQLLLNNHMYLYKKHDHRALFWEQRKLALMREFEEHNADIMCLQEVQEDHIKSFYSQLNQMGYKSLYKKRTGNSYGDGCAIYYKDSLFNLVEHTTVEYYQTTSEILDRPNVAIIAKFSEKKNPAKQFVVATTHLLFNPRRQDVRLAQTQVLLAEIDRLAFDKITNNTETYLPIIITGDFNLQPNTAPYQLLLNGAVEYEKLTNRVLEKPYTTQQWHNLQGKFLLPDTLRITDNCQHAEIVNNRFYGNKHWSRQKEWEIIQLEHSDRSKPVKSNSNYKENPEDFQSGRLSHNLNLKSVYTHRRCNSSDGFEATTHQEKWITVDYLLYSARATKNKADDRLKLLSKFQLPTIRECNQLPSIPNLVYGSDHISLIAKFVLTD